MWQVFGFGQDLRHRRTFYDQAPQEVHGAGAEGIDEAAD